MAIKFDGLNTENGITRSGGKIEFYLDTLAAFSEDGDYRIREIKKSLETGNLPLYVTHVHGVKSAARFTGREEISTRSKLKPQRITHDQASEVIESRQPLGLFYYSDKNGVWIGIDNSTGDAWTEEFKKRRKCLAWLWRCSRRRRPSGL